jgi:hypothetical protein
MSFLYLKIFVTLFFFFSLKNKKFHKNIVKQVYYKAITIKKKR